MIERSSIKIKNIFFKKSNLLYFSELKMEENSEFLLQFSENPYKFLISDRTSDIEILKLHKIESYLSPEFIDACFKDDKIQNLNDFYFVDSNLTGILQNYSHIFNYFIQYCEYMIMIHYPKGLIIGSNFHVVPIILIHSTDKLTEIVEFYRRFYDCKEETNCYYFISRFFRFKICKKLYRNISEAIKSLKVDINQIFIDMNTKLMFCSHKAALAFKTNTTVLNTTSVYCYAFSVKNYGFEILIPGTNKFFPKDFSNITNCIIDNANIINSVQGQLISAIASIYLNRTITYKTDLDLDCVQQQFFQELVLEDRIFKEEKHVQLNRIKKSHDFVLTLNELVFIDINENILKDDYYTYNKRIDMKYKKFFKFIIEKYNVVISGAYANALFMNCEIEGETTIYINKDCYFLTTNYLKFLFLELIYGIKPNNIHEVENPNLIIRRYSDKSNEYDISILMETLKLHNKDINDNVDLIQILNENKKYNINIRIPKIKIKLFTDIYNVIEDSGIIASKTGFYCKTEELYYLSNFILIDSFLFGQGVRNKGQIKIEKLKIDKIESKFDITKYLLNYSFEYIKKSCFNEHKIKNHIIKKQSNFTSSFFGKNLSQLFFRVVFPNSNTMVISKFVNLNKVEKQIFISILEKRSMDVRGNYQNLVYYYGNHLSSNDLICFLKNVNFYINYKYFHEICNFISSKIYLNREICEEEFIGYYYDINERNRRIYEKSFSRFSFFYKYYDIKFKKFVSNSQSYTIEELKESLDI